MPMDPFVILAAFLVYIGVPVTVLLFAQYAKSLLAKWLLRGTAVLSLAILGLVMLASLDCEQNDFTFKSCNRLPEAFGDVMGFVQIIYVVSYLTAGPAVLLLAAGLECWTRLKPGSTS